MIGVTNLLKKFNTVDNKLPTNNNFEIFLTDQQERPLEIQLVFNVKYFFKNLLCKRR